MGTEKFIAFKEDGTAYRLKGRILRFLDNEPVSEDDKTNIRSTLSVPASAEGLTPANNLSDLDNAATARANLSVNSVDEDAEATATKLVGPAMYFDGSNDYLEVADDAKFSFTDGTDDLPFSVSAWIKMEDATTFPVLSKYGSGSSTREFSFITNGSDKLKLLIQDTSGNETSVDTVSAVTDYEGSFIHVAATYGGAGINSDSAFTNNISGNAAIYINGVSVDVVENNNASYSGMSDTAQALYIGRSNTAYARGHIKDVKIFNRELTAAEVAQLARGTDLGFSSEWGGALGAVYTSDFSAGVDSFVAGNGTADGNIDAIDGQDDNLRLTVNTSNSTHNIYRSGILSVGKRYRIEFDYYIPSTNSHLDSIRLQDGTLSWVVYSSPTLNAWNRGSAESVAGNTFVRFDGMNGGNAVFEDTLGNDVLYVRNIKVTEIGTLADFRAEDFNESAGKLLDRSTNNFVGVNNGATLVGARRHISADTIDLKNLPTSSAGLSAGEVWSNSGVLTIV